MSYFDRLDALAVKEPPKRAYDIKTDQFTKPAPVKAKGGRPKGSKNKAKP